jgi:hypothetical protein
MMDEGAKGPDGRRREHAFMLLVTHIASFKNQPKEKRSKNMLIADVRM